jgi:hypothetical protein
MVFLETHLWGGIRDKGAQATIPGSRIHSPQGAELFLPVR